MQHHKTANEYVITIDKGEEVIETLTTFCAEHDITNAHFTGIGAMEYVSCGYYDLSEKKYHFKQYEQPVEVVSSVGNVMINNEKPFVHLHAIFTDTDNAAFGGHIDAMRVGVTFEIVLTPLESNLSRKPNDAIGLSLINCGSESA